MALLLAVACDDEGPQFQRLGLASDSSGLLIRYLPCSNERIDHIQLWQLDGDQIAMDDGDQLLWQSDGESDGVSGEGVRPIGSDGSPLVLDPAADYWVDVSTSRGDSDVDKFRVNDLKPGTWRTGLKANLDETELVRRAKKSC